MDYVKIESSYLLKQNYGFLGECYYEMKRFDLIDSHLIDKYFSVKTPFYCNRNAYCYTTDINLLKKRVFEYPYDLDTCINEINEFEIRKDLIYSILSHEINDISKALGVIFSHELLREKYYDEFKSFIQKKCEDLIKCLFSDKLIFDNLRNEKLWTELFDDINSINNLSIREYSEMDNHLLLVKSFFAYKEFIEDKEVLVGPIQGAGMIPPFYISMLKRFSNLPNNILWKFDYMRHSNYDNEQYLDIKPQEQVGLLSKKYDSDTSILLIDDTTGTATTIKTLKEFLKMNFTDITTCVIECRWNTKINNAEYSAFGMNDVDIISPLEYRHFKDFADEIDYIRDHKKIKIKYITTGFYKEKYIYNEINFRKYIESSEISKPNKKRLLKIIENYELITMIKT